MAKRKNKLSPLRVPWPRIIDHPSPVQLWDWLCWDDKLVALSLPRLQAYFLYPDTCTCRRFSSRIRPRLFCKRYTNFSSIQILNSVIRINTISVDRDIMMEKWEKLGIKGNMYKMINTIYGETWNEVISGMGITEKF